MKVLSICILSAVAAAMAVENIKRDSEPINYLGKGPDDCEFRDMRVTSPDHMRYIEAHPQWIRCQKEKAEKRAMEASKIRAALSATEEQNLRALEDRAADLENRLTIDGKLNIKEYTTIKEDSDKLDDELRNASLPSELKSAIADKISLLYRAFHPKDREARNLCKNDRNKYCELYTYEHDTKLITDYEREAREFSQMVENYENVYKLYEKLRAVHEQSLKVGVVAMDEWENEPDYQSVKYMLAQAESTERDATQVFYARRRAQRAAQRDE